MAETSAEQISRSITGTPLTQVGSAFAVDLTTHRVITGTTTIDDSVQTESTPYAILTIAPQTGAPLLDCKVWFDLAKATTGYAAVESSATITFQVARKIDGTNWRRFTITEAALSGTLAATRAMEVPCGFVSETQGCQIFITMSADATSNMDLPYCVVYRAAQAPTITNATTD